MKTDVGGWTTRLTDEMIARFTASGAWRNRTVWNDAVDRLASDADRVAVIDGERVTTFRRLVEDGARLASALAARGLKAGDVISFQLPNWTETMVLNLAAAKLGLVCNPIVPIYRDAEVRHILRDARARLFFVPPSFRSFDYLAMARRLRGDLPDLSDVVVVRGQADDAVAFDDLLASGAAESGLDGSADPNAVKLLMYTSGTTGAAKGVLHSHNTIHSEIDAVIGFWRIRRDDVVLMPSPVTHITGYLYALEIAFAAGVKVVFMERWNAVEAADLIRRHGVTFSVGATPFLKELVAAIEASGQPVPSLRLFMSGGAPVPPEVIQRANRVMTNCSAFRVYGSTEAPTVTLGIQGPAEAELGATTDGRIVGHEVRLRDTATGRVISEDGVDGEITTRGPEMMIGYTTAAQTAESFDADGFFATGDLGYTVKGEYLCVSGRRKDLIIRGGENLSPKEIEDVMHLHPAIREAAVVAMPHERLGEGVCAFVIPHDGRSVDVATVAAHLEQAGLAPQKRPERVEIVDDLPRTPSGKVQKNVLRQRIAEILAREAARPVG